MNFNSRSRSIVILPLLLGLALSSTAKAIEVSDGTVTPAAVEAAIQAVLNRPISDTEIEITIWDRYEYWRNDIFERSTVKFTVAKDDKQHRFQCTLFYNPRAADEHAFFIKYCKSHTAEAENFFLNRKAVLRKSIPQRTFPR